MSTITQALTEPSEYLFTKSQALINNSKENRFLNYLRKTAGVTLMGLSAIVALVELAVKGIFTMIAYPLLSLAEKAVKQQSKEKIQNMKGILLKTTLSPSDTMLNFKTFLNTGVNMLIKKFKASFSFQQGEA